MNAGRYLSRCRELLFVPLLVIPLLVIPARVTAANYWVTIDVGGWGYGAISYSLASGSVVYDLECTTDTWCSLSQICWMQVTGGTKLTLIAAPNTGSTFDFKEAKKGEAVGWTTGPCRGSTGPCNLTVTSDLEFEGDFARRDVALPVVAVAFGLGVDIAGYCNGSVSATIDGTPLSLDCFDPESAYYREICYADVREKTLVTLTPTAASGCGFAGWSDAQNTCSGLGPCTATMSAAHDIVATFNPACTVANGTGVQTWDAASNTWACTASACNTGYSLTNGTCVGTYRWVTVTTTGCNPMCTSGAPATEPFLCYPASGPELIGHGPFTCDAAHVGGYIAEGEFFGGLVFGQFGWLSYYSDQGGGHDLAHGINYPEYTCAAAAPIPIMTIYTCANQ